MFLDLNIRPGGFHQNLWKSMSFAEIRAKNFQYREIVAAYVFSFKRARCDHLADREKCARNFLFVFAKIGAHTAENERSKVRSFG